MSMNNPLPALDDLDIAFELPDTISDKKLRTLYEVLVVRMRRECAHLPMNTVQQLLIERIAFNYIVLRYKESRPAGEEGGFQSPTQQKDYNTFWLSMTQELNKQMRSTDADFRNQVFKVMGEVVAGVLKEIEDPVLRRKIQQRLADQLSREGL